MIGIILQIIMAALKREKYYVMVLRPYRRRNAGHNTGVSLAVIHDGMYAAIRYMQDTGSVRVNFSDYERAFFGIPDDVNFTGL